MAGQGAAAGAALGPWGAIAGGVIGGAAGLVMQKKKEAEYNNKVIQKSINSNLDSISMASNNIKSRNSIYSPRNYSVPGYKDGVASAINPNALVSNGEGFRDPITGRVGTFPGEPNNNDSLAVQLQEGTSIYSNAYKLPYGKKLTPAKAIAKMEAVQKIDDKMAKFGGQINDNTKKLNDINRKKQTELLNMNTQIENMGKSKPKFMPKFAGGTHYYTEPLSTYSKLPFDKATAERMAKQGMYYSGADESGRHNWHAQFKPEISDKFNEAQRAGKIYAALTADENGLMRIGGVSKLDPVATTNLGADKEQLPISTQVASAQQANPSYNGIVPGVLESDWNTMMNRGIKAGQPGYNPDWVFKGQAVPLSEVRRSAAAGEQNRYTLDNTGTAWIPMTNTSTKPILKPSTAVSPQKGSTLQQAPAAQETALKQAETPAVATPAIAPKVAAVEPQKAATVEEPKKEFTAENGLTTEVFNKGFGDYASELGYNLASLAPVAANWFGAKPEYETPRYETAINPTLRVNMSKQVEDARKKSQIARYNQRVMNSGTGAGTTFGASTYAAGLNNLNAISANADNINNEYRAKSAAISNEIASRNANVFRENQKSRMQTDANVRAHKKAALAQFSDYAQNKQLMKNQKERDILNSEVFASFANLPEAERQKFFGMMTSKRPVFKKKTTTKTATT
jgi:gas vesicle protein